MDSIRMPNLVIGRTYRWEELAGMIADDDRKHIVGGDFPFKLDTWRHDPLQYRLMKRQF